MNDQAEAQWRHNWLYSVVPAGSLGGGYGTIEVYLTGYCRNCDQGFTRKIETDGSVRKMDIPKWGCVDPNIP